MLSLTIAAVASALAISIVLERRIRLERRKDDLTAAVVHDLKTPMAVVLQNLDLAMADLGDAAHEDDVRHSLSDAHEGAVGALRLILNLLDIARMESNRIVVRRVATDGAALLGRLVRLRAREARDRRVALELDVSLDEPLHADPDLLSRTVDNILDNALRHTPREGRVLVSAARVDDSIEIRVGNSGAAIPPADRERVFDKFAQLERGHHHNVGLGLYFCRLVTEAHGGRLSIDSTPALPTVFVLRVPAAAYL